MTEAVNETVEASLAFVAGQTGDRTNTEDRLCITTGKMEIILIHTT